MAEPRRRRAAGEEKVSALLDATEQIMLSDGYAAVSSRSVAARVGINASLVHYYFPTLDDLFVAVLRRRATPNVERMSEALATPEPLRAWWELASDSRGAGLFIELMAAANHRPALRSEVGHVARQVRRMQTETLTTLSDEYGLDPDTFPPALVAAAIQGLAFGLVADEAAGYETMQGEVRSGATRLLTRLEQQRRERRSLENVSAPAATSKAQVDARKHAPMAPLERRSPSNTRERILATAFELFVDQGFQGTTLVEIERRVGLAVGTGSLYHHFRSKEELLRAVIEREVAVRLEELQQERAALSWPDDPYEGQLLAARLALNNIRRFVPLQKLLQAEGDRVPDLYTTFDAALAEAGAFDVWTQDANRTVAVSALAGYEFLRGGQSRDQDVSEEQYLEALVAMLPPDSLPGVAPPLTSGNRDHSD